MSQWIILKDYKRYPNTAEKLPYTIISFGTRSQAEEIAFILSSEFAGCTDIFYVASTYAP